MPATGPVRTLTRSHVGVYPLDPPRVSSSGPSPYRVLIVGGETLAGQGVTTHGLALTGCLARSLGIGIEHGVDVEGVLLPELGFRHYEHELRSRALAHIDAVVLLLERDDHGARPMDTVRSTLTALAEQMADSAVLMVAIAPSGSAVHSATQVEGATRRAAYRLAEVVSLDPDPTTTRSPVERYIAWADTIAAPLASLLRGPRSTGASVEVVEERSRLRAVREAFAAAAASEQGLTRMVNFASASYRTRSAAISLIDGTTVRYICRRHLEDEAQLRELTVCSAAMQIYGGLIVPDARIDERFAHIPAIRAGDAAFYAGHRLVSPDGLPIGTLCVFDPDPRHVADHDLVALRDFALAAERRLWRAWQTAGARVELAAGRRDS